MEVADGAPTGDLLDRDAARTVDIAVGFVAEDQGKTSVMSQARLVVVPEIVCEARRPLPS